MEKPELREDDVAGEILVQKAKMNIALDAWEKRLPAEVFSRNERDGFVRDVLAEAMRNVVPRRVVLMPIDHAIGRNYEVSLTPSGFVRRSRYREVGTVMPLSDINLQGVSWKDVLEKAIVAVEGSSFRTKERGLERLKALKGLFERHGDVIVGLKKELRVEIPAGVRVWPGGVWQENGKVVVTVMRWGTRNVDVNVWGGDMNSGSWSRLRAGHMDAVLSFMSLGDRLGGILEEADKKLSDGVVAEKALVDDVKKVFAKEVLALKVRAMS